jgi:hypothetical protein
MWMMESTVVNLAWLVGSDDELEDVESVDDLWRDGWFPELILVYAPTAMIACAVAWPHWAAAHPADCGRWVAPKALRYPAADHLAALESRPRRERSPYVFRDLGWFYEDEDQCDSCGLYPFGLPEFDTHEDEEGDRVCNRCAGVWGEALALV